MGDIAIFPAEVNNPEWQTMAQPPLCTLNKILLIRQFASLNTHIVTMILLRYTEVEGQGY